MGKAIKIKSRNIDASGTVKLRTTFLASLRKNKTVKSVETITKRLKNEVVDRKGKLHTEG